jgi:hypothetical protein
MFAVLTDGRPAASSSDTPVLYQSGGGGYFQAAVDFTFNDFLKRSHPSPWHQQLKALDKMATSWTTNLLPLFLSITALCTSVSIFSPVDLLRSCHELFPSGAN